MQMIDVGTGLCRIPFSSIKPAKEFDEFEFGFFNPRILDSKNREYYGFSQEEIDSLKDSIKSKGLMENLHVNNINSEHILIDGHRRHEAIKQLLEENALCYDRHTNQHVPAKDIYSEVIVTIHQQLNASQCFSRAFESDCNKISFGENATIRFVDYCISFNMPENKIIEMCGKSISWLRATAKLLQKVKADSDVKEALLDGRINASAANSLMDIENEEERQAIFETALKKAEKQKEEAEDYGDIEDADALIEKHASTLEERKRERNDITPRINNKNLEEAIDDIDGDVDDLDMGHHTDELTTKKKKEPKLTMKSIRDTWTKDIETSISRGHMTDEHETIIPILNKCFADMVKAMFEEKISYQDFIYRWSNRFIEAGLSTNAGEDVDINGEIG